MRCFYMTSTTCTYTCTNMNIGTPGSKSNYPRLTSQTCDCSIQLKRNLKGLNLKVKNCFSQLLGAVSTQNYDRKTEYNNYWNTSSFY